MKKLLINCFLGLLVLGLGIFILLQPNAFLKTLVLVFGLYILLEGLSSILYSLKLKSCKNVFRLSLVKSLLNFGVGLLVCYFSLTAKGAEITTWIVYLIATELLLSGLLTLLDTYYLRKLDVLGLGIYLGSDIAVSLIFAILLFLFPSFIGTTVITILGIIVILLGTGIFGFGIFIYSRFKHLAKESEEIVGEFSKIE